MEHRKPVGERREWHPGLQRLARKGCRRLGQVADGGVVAAKPGNAGGGKAP
jgi:hypothetical protein